MKEPRLSREDIAEGKELMEILESLSAEKRVLAKVYLLALTNKKEYQEATEKKE